MTNQNAKDQEKEVGKYHLEISQSVQDFENSIPLIRGKRTYARAYVDHDSFTGFAEGVYRARLHLTDPVKEFASLNSVSLDPKNPVSRNRQRVNWDLSFNFEFDPGWDKKLDKFNTGDLELVLDSSDTPTRLKADDDSKEFTVVASPCLKVTCLLLRYWNDEAEEYIMPDPLQVDTIREFVVSAFPVAEDSVEWNTITVQATNDFQSLNKLTKPGPVAEEAASLAIRELLLQATVHRNMDTYHEPKIEWRNTHDIRTIYLAVFDDPSDRLGGAATDSPKFPVHNIAGAAMVDLSGQIGAHELAHMLGLDHPGVPWHKKYGPHLGQRLEDDELKKKYKKPKKKYVYQGFLNVDSATAQGLHISPQLRTPRIYEPNLHFDLMTYREPQWLSDYSYRKIRQRLYELYQYGKKTSYTTQIDSRVVIGEYDLNRQTGRILFVLPTSYNGLDLQLRKFKAELIKTKDAVMPSQLENYDQITDQLKINLIATIKDDKDATDTEDDATCERVKKDNIWYKICTYQVYHRLPDDGREKQRDMPNYGIFQATIETNKLEKIELKVAGNVVDVFEAVSTQQEYEYITLLKDLVDSLEKNTWDQVQAVTRIEHPARYMRNNKNLALLFYYDVIEDEYYLRFNWLALSAGDNRDGVKREHLLDSKLISVIQCKRPDRDEWVTVAASSRRKGNIWISPDLVNRAEYSTDPEFRGKAFYSHLTKTARSLRSISKDSIKFRILFSAGFDKANLDPVTTTAKIYFPTEFLQNQQDRLVSEDYLGKKNPSMKNLSNRSGKHRSMY